MAKRQFDDNLLEEITNRISYLTAICEDNIFKNEPKTDYSVNLLVYNLQQVLEKNIRPEIQAKICQQTSRDLFEKLQKETKHVVSNAVSGLFYLYYEDCKMQDIFDVYYSNLVISSQLAILNNSSLGELFNHIFEHGKSVRQASIEYKQALPLNNFIERNTGEPDSLKLANLMVKSDTKSNGIHPKMNNQHNMELLLKALGTVLDFSHLINASQQAFTLAGMGGDIMMYVLLCREINGLMSCFATLQGKLQDAISVIQEQADDIYHKLMEVQDYNEPWRQSYSRSKRYFELGKQHMGECNKLLQTLTLQMLSVNSRDYASEVRDNMTWFKHTVSELQARIEPVNASSIEADSKKQLKRGSSAEIRMFSVKKEAETEEDLLVRAHMFLSDGTENKNVNPQ